MSLIAEAVTGAAAGAAAGAEGPPVCAAMPMASFSESIWFSTLSWFAVGIGVGSGVGSSVGAGVGSAVG
jgi:hypothetical protein